MWSWTKSAVVGVSLLCFFAAAAPSPIQVRDVDQGTFNNLQLFSQFCAAAYCPSNNDKGTTPTKIACTAKNCPLVEADNVTSVLEFQNSFFTDVTGYVAIDYTRSLIVLAFRGSKSLQNYLADVDVALTNTNICGTCQATQGFYGSWLEARGQVLPALKTAAASHPGFKLVVAGHSLGGAIATLAAADLRNLAYAPTVDLYTYGSPRVGQSGLATYINAQSTTQGKGQQYRVTHGDDPVPRLPPYSLGFRHYDPEYFVNTGNGQSVTTASITKIVVATQGNGVGDDGAFNPFDADLAAHGDYFGPIGACDSS